MARTPGQQAWFDRHRQVNTWVEPDEFDELKHRANEAGMTLSAYIRDVISVHIVRAPRPQRRADGQAVSPT